MKIWGYLLGFLSCFLFVSLIVVALTFSVHLDIVDGVLDGVHFVPSGWFYFFMVCVGLIAIGTIYSVMSLTCKFWQKLFD